MLKYLFIFLLFSCFLIQCSLQDARVDGMQFITMRTFILWPNATVPFYINPDHFDSEQAAIIMTCLSMIAFKTCIKFAPVMTAPLEGQHVMTFVNPGGVKRCRIQLQGHSNYHPHIVLVGYECLKTPEIYMIVLRALGLPFEHNRISRDVYIEVLIENIEPSYVELFTKANALPQVLRSLPYDPNSVMHFGERDYSKNGHRTIIFKHHSFRQNRQGLSQTDVKKIELIYGAECINRERAEKFALCQSYPGLARRKREIVEPPANKSLRVNPYITPPPHILAGLSENPEKHEETMNNTKQECVLKTLGIVTEADKIIDLVYQLSNLALKNAREKYCNISSNLSSEIVFNYDKAQYHTSSPDVLGIFQILGNFAKSIVDDSVRDLKEFCQNSDTIEAYQSQCKFDNDTRCPKTFRPSKSEAVRFTNDRKEMDEEHKNQKTDDNSNPTSLKSKRRKRRATTDTSSEEIKEKVVKKKKTARRDNKKDIVAQKEKNKEKLTQKEKKNIKEGVTEMNLKLKVKAIRKERLKEIQRRNTTTEKLEVVSPTTFATAAKVEEDKKRILRKFSSKRYKIEDRDNSGDASDITVEKTEPVVEPEKSLGTAQETLKKLIVKGLAAVIKPALDKEEKTTESVESKEETKVNEAVKEKSAQPVSEDEEIHKKADASVEQTGSTDVEEEQEKQTSKKPKRKIPKTVELTELNKEFYKERKWPDGVVVYAIEKLADYDLGDLRSRLEEVNTILKQKTCVKLREVDIKEAPGFDDYLILDKSPDYVTGRVGRQQNFGCIELFEGGQHKQHTAMMVMAMLGFYFEVSRHDRDKYIRVHNRHIRPDKLHHFEMITPEATLNIPYDFKSATHPSFEFWRKIGKTSLAAVATYKKKDPDGSVMRSLGQNPELLSEYDILKINSVYGVDCFQPVSAKKEAGRMQNEKEEEEMVIQ